MNPVSKGAFVPPPQHSGPADRRHRFDELYTANHKQILGYLLRRTENTDDAADVFAETFLVAWRRLDDVPADHEGRLWLYGTARRILANYRRGERRRVALADRLRADLAARYRPQQLSGELAEIGVAFRKLPETDQELLALVGWEGLDPGQIAAVLGCSRNAARIRLHRARRRLSAELARSRSGPLPTPVHVTNGDLS
jgi:RNA polymerase sigma-70 factor (ECF subfamily)